MQIKTIQQRITFWAGACLLVTAIIFISYSAFNIHHITLEQTRTRAMFQTQSEAARIQAGMEEALTTARTLAEVMQRIKQHQGGLPADRQAVNALLKSISESHPQFLGVYTLWEPNVFGGKTSETTATTEATDNGRFMIYWERTQEGQLQPATLTNYDTEGSGDYYLVPKRMQRQSIVGPSAATVTGRKAMVVSFVHPILVEGRFLGICGVDLPLNRIQDNLQLATPLNGAGSFVMVNNEGVIATNAGVAEQSGKKVVDVLPELSDKLDDIREGRSTMDLAGDALKVTVPLKIGDSPANWALCLIAPTDKVTATANLRVAQQVGLGLLLTGLALLLLWWFAGQLAKPIREATKFAKRIAAGEPVEKIVTHASDETGELAAAMNSMLEKNHLFLQTKGERDRIQDAIMRLLEEVSSVAGGDLTREAQVTEDATGAIADSFNFMIVELRKIIGKVQTVANAVNHSASYTNQSTRQLAQGAELQASQIIQTSHDVEAMADSIHQVSVTAGTSQTVAEQSLRTAREGARLVQDSIESMSKLRDQVQETAKRIKRVGENSQEIGEIVQLISDIAYRTSVLALNASIQAARAGDAGRGFGVVAEEVERLAKRSTEAAQHITELVQAAQANTKEAIAAMEESTRGVVEGANLIHQAGTSLTEIEAVSTQLAQLVGSISSVTERQSSDSRKVAQTMAQISTATQATAVDIKQSAQTVNQLATLAHDLQVSVATFKVAASTANLVGQPGAASKSAMFSAPVASLVPTASTLSPNTAALWPPPAASTPTSD